MGATLVRGKYVICKVTGPSSAQVVSDGALYQRDGEIIEVGRYDDLRTRYPSEEVIGSSNHVVMPGLVNDHFHVGLTPFQLGAPDLPLEMWGIARMAARSVDPYLDQLYGAVQMIESGTTTVQAIHRIGFGAKAVDPAIADIVIAAFGRAGMRVSYAPVVANQNYLMAGALGGEKEFASQLPGDLGNRYLSFIGGGNVPVQEVMSGIDEICKKYGDKQHELVRITMAPSNVHRCTDDLLIAFKEMASKHDTGIHIHLQESIYQKLYGLWAWDKTPLRHLHELGFLGPEVTCGHSVWVTDEDMGLMASTGTAVCHNASSNLRLQCGIAPIGQLMGQGIRIAIGSDEAGINDDKDLFQEMRLVLKLHWVPGVENTPPTAHEVFQMATANGAKASWFGERIGTLEPGKRADIVLMDLQNIEEPYLDPDVSIVDAVVHRGRGIDVDTVIIDGDVVMQDRHLTHVDKESLFKEIKESMDRPLRPTEEKQRELSKEIQPHIRRFFEGTLPKNPSPYTHYNGRS